MDRSKFADEIAKEKERRHPLVKITQIDDHFLKINDRKYQIVADQYDTFDLKALQDRYNPDLNRFDYLLGDWSYDQLRLTGFYDARRRVPKERKINYLQDYLTEYCNFGTTYFILKRLGNSHRYHSRK